MHGKRQQHPHHHVVDQPGRLQTAEQRHQEGEHPQRRRDVGRGGKKCEAGCHLHQVEAKNAGVREPRQRIVPGRRRRVAAPERIEAEGSPHATQAFGGSRNELGPAGEFIAEEHPGDARQNRYRKHDRRVGVDGAGITHHVQEPRLPRHNHKRPTDVDAGDGEDHNRQRDRPVADPDRNLPGVIPLRARARGIDRRGHRFERAGSQGVGIHDNFTPGSRTSVTGRRRASTTCTPQAIHGSNECTVRRISTGCSGSATGVSSRDCS